MSRRARTTTSNFRRGVLATTTGLACVAALAAAPASAAVDSEPAIKTLKGLVGPGFDISISDDTVSAGRYKLVVNDKGTIHNWHITGAGVDKATSVPGTGKSVFKVKLKPGTYTIVCDAHPGTMMITLTVT